MKLLAALTITAVTVLLYAVAVAPRHPASIHKGLRWE
jgi:hypothetical protein